MSKNMASVTAAEVDKIRRAFLRTEGNYDADKVSDETGLFCEDPSLAVQEQAHEADINNILKNYGITGKLPENVRVPSFGDFTEITDYREALMAIEGARDSFMKLPSSFRAELQNDPQLFIEFCANKDNLPRMRELGLAVPVESSGGTSTPEGATPAPTT